MLLLAACGGSGAGPTVDVKGEPVSFTATDGVRLEGRAFGSGSVGVVLVHMGRGGDTQADWYPAARELARRGYLALTFNRRGVCPRGGNGCSRGTDDYASSWRDVVGAYHYVRRRGARRVVLVGASIGAMSSLFAAARRAVSVAALVEVGGINHASGYDFSRSDIARIRGAKLFVSSRGDVYGGAAAAREWYAWATEPKRLELLPGSEHGTDLLRKGAANRGRLLDVIAGFVERYAAPD